MQNVSMHATPFVYVGCDIGGAKELGVMYFPTNWGAKEPQNLPNHRVAILFCWIHVGTTPQNYAPCALWADLVLLVYDPS